MTIDPRVYELLAEVGPWSGLGLMITHVIYTTRAQYNMQKEKEK